jgi:hypothetical protein
MKVYDIALNSFHYATSSRLIAESFNNELDVAGGDSNFAWLLALKDFVK